MKHPFTWDHRWMYDQYNEMWGVFDYDEEADIFYYKYPYLAG